jgi:hypothetical protein
MTPEGEGTRGCEREKESTGARVLHKGVALVDGDSAKEGNKDTYSAKV